MTKLSRRIQIFFHSQTISSSRGLLLHHPHEMQETMSKNFRKYYASLKFPVHNFQKRAACLKFKEEQYSLHYGQQFSSLLLLIQQTDNISGSTIVPYIACFLSVQSLLQAEVFENKIDIVCKCVSFFFITKSLVSSSAQDSICDYFSLL